MKTFLHSLAFAFALLWALSAHAGAARIGNTYYEDFFPVKTCNTTSICTAPATSSLPADAYFRMQHYYCSVAVNSGTLYALQLEVWSVPPGTGGASPVKTAHLSLPQPVSFLGINFYDIDHEILLVAGFGRYVAFKAATTGTVDSISLSCAISGDLIPPPQ